MNWHELFQPSFFKPMLWSGGIALLLFVLAWWREREPRVALPPFSRAVVLKTPK